MKISTSTSTASTTTTSTRRVLPERVMKVLTIDVSKGHKQLPEISATNPQTGQVENVRDYLETNQALPKWWPMVWKKISGNDGITVSLLKNQKQRYSVEIRNPTTKRVIVNHSLNTDITLKSHNGSLKPTTMWMTSYDISQEEVGGGTNDKSESLICITFENDHDKKKFINGWLECQRKMA